VEYIPTRQWYHRHTRSLYWEGKLILPFGDNFLFRLLLGWMMPPKVSFLKLTQGDAIRNYYHERHMCQVRAFRDSKVPGFLMLWADFRECGCVCRVTPQRRVKLLCGWCGGCRPQSAS
jgi:hypothetical protein